MIANDYGQVTVPGIQDEILSQYGSAGIQPQDIENKRVAEFISDLITAEQRQTPSTDLSVEDIGKGVGIIDVEDNDEANTDFYHGLMPNSE